MAVEESDEEQVTTDADVIKSIQEDFLTGLNDAGTPVIWEQRQVSERNKYGEPVPKFNPTKILALVRLLQPFEVRLVEPGFVMQNYLKILFDPAVNIAILDRIVYGGAEYEVRFVAPHQVAGVTDYAYAILRILITPPSG